MEENKLFEALLDVIPFAAYAVDIDTYEVVYANKLMTETMFSPRETFCWKRLFGQEEVCSWCTIPELKQREAVYKSEKLISNFFDEATDRWFQSYDELVRWPDGRTVKYSIAVDISEQKEVQASMIQTLTELAVKSKKLKEANSKLEFMATKDYLTGINNRGNFFNLGKKLIDKSIDKKLSLYAAMFDLDKFKNINDMYGHSTGDIALKEFTRVVEKNLHKDDIFGRLGGEEFALLIPMQSQSDIIQRLETIKNAVEKITIIKDDQEIHFTVSIGLDQMKDDDTLDSLLERVDKELYGAKESGRNIIKFRGVEC